MRLIHDCSRPVGAALNDFAEGEGFSYQTLKDAASLIQQGDYIAKLDLSNAYRSVKVHPKDQHLTGLQWTFKGDTKPTFLCDKRLPFGASSSPAIFNQLTQAVRVILAREGETKIVAYLDDFLCVGRTKEECMRTLNRLLVTLRKLGFSVNYNKVVGPTKNLVFLGVEIDTEDFTLSLPESKVTQLQQDLEDFMGLKSVTKRELQSIAGKLNWASQVIFGGRAHLRRIIDRINALNAPCHRTRLTTAVKEDLQWWILNVRAFNGGTPIAESRLTAHVCIDACNEGAGGFFGKDWYHLKWRDWPGTVEKHINYKEVLALAPAADLWGHLWTGKRILVYSDNQAAVGILNRGTAKDPFVMSVMRRIFWLSVWFNFRIRAIYYPGYLNIVADAASRLEEPGGKKKLEQALASVFHY